MDNQKAITLVLNTLYEVSKIEKTAPSEDLKDRLINYKADDLLKKLAELRKEGEQDA